MPRTRSPRRGSMQYWPRVRAAREHARVRAFAPLKEAKPLLFAGYKAGMTHVILTENRANSPSKGAQVAMPVTVIECPPIRVFGAVAYTKDAYGKKISMTVLDAKHDKDLARVMPLPKKHKHTLDSIKPDSISELHLLVHTQPRLTGIGKKAPEVFEVPIGGATADQIAYAKTALGKDLTVKDFFTVGMQVDTHAITTGKGTQGPVKRFGVALRSHKAEKTKRGPGSLGPWPNARTMRVAHLGQMGYHTRTERNKVVLQIGDDPKQVTPAGGFIGFGAVRNGYILLHGSISGPKKRLIKFTRAALPNKHFITQAPTISTISKISQQ